MPKYVLVDKRFGRLCEFLDFTHGETADLEWFDVTNRPEVTLEWTWKEGVFIEPAPKPEPVPMYPINDAGPQTYTFNAGQGLGWHSHPPGYSHDHKALTGSTLVTVQGKKPETVSAGTIIVLPPDLSHSIIALEDNTTFVNTKA